MSLIVIDSFHSSEDANYNIKDLNALVWHIRKNMSNIYKDGFEIITPKIEQEVIDNLPRYYDYEIGCFYHKEDMFDDGWTWETVNIRFRLIDNGNETITIKCNENDLYNVALETINLGLNKYCYINPINNNLYHFQFKDENLLTVFNWIKNKRLPLKVDFIYNNKQYSINRKIKSINSLEILSQHIEEDCEIERKYINGILFDEDSILVEFE